MSGTRNDEYVKLNLLDVRDALGAPDINDFMQRAAQLVQTTDPYHLICAFAATARGLVETLAERDNCTIADVIANERQRLTEWWARLDAQ